MVYQWFGLKTTTTVSWFGPQIQGQQFGELSLKMTMMFSWFAPQNRRTYEDGVRTRVDIQWLASS
jgi:hypothetical protein